ncbi:putative transporter [Marinilabiliaceae bacterium JC040]|nr:putative transporter [Marinilabiliaceae bacterium JC040]
MNLLEIINGNATIASIVYLCLAAFTGILIGKIKIFKVSIGIAGVLFTSILIGHFGVSLDKNILHFVKEFGLILFVFSIGLEVGPGFIATLKSQGIKLNALATLIIFLGFAIAVGIHFVTGIDPATLVGILCGAVTNTPGLGAAQQTLTDLGASADKIAISGTGYAIAYPFGIMGIIFTMIITRIFFKININKEVDNYDKKISEQQQRLESVFITISNKNLINKKVEFLRKFTDNKIVISRIKRNGEFIIPREDSILIENDIVYGVTNKPNIDVLQLLVGDVKICTRKQLSGRLQMKDFLVTNHKIAGKTISQFGIYRRYSANITRIFRSGVEIMPSLNTSIEFGDRVRVIGEVDTMPEIKKEIGNSIKELVHPNVIPLFAGIFVGVILGCIPIFIPGLSTPVKLGLAGGPLIVALFLGHKVRIGNMNFYLSTGANYILRELGITLFLACVGLGAGANFWHALTHGGLTFMMWGAVITFIPIMITSIIARIMGYNYLTICGIVAGAMTDPPALGFANSLAESQAQATGYATVYPLTMFLRIMTAQLFVIVCS